MNIRTIARRSAVGVAALSLIAVTAGPVLADDVVVADSSAHGALVAAAGASSARTGPRAVASIPGGIVVTQHGGKPVSLFAKGQPPLLKTRPGNAPAAFTGLEVGTSYTVVVGGRSLGQVVPVDRPSAVTRLLVHAAAPAGTVVFTWRYRDLASTGGASVSFDLSATSPTAARVTARVTDTRTASLPGLDPTALYTFSITPANSAGKGRSTTARMTTTLAQLSDPTPPAAPTPVTPTPSPSPTPSPTRPPTPPPAPGPAPTRVIYVCPDGSTQTPAGVCQIAIPYTYHSVTQTQPYTYHGQFVETSRTWRDFGTDWSGTTCPYGGTMHDGHCVGWDIQGVTVQVKDTPPSGWLDDGTQYVKTVQVKNDPPAGYTDDGTQWVKFVPTEARTVPA